MSFSFELYYCFLFYFSFGRVFMEHFFFSSLAEIRQEIQKLFEETPGS